MPRVPEKNHWEQVHAERIKEALAVIDGVVENQEGFCRIFELFEERISRVEQQRRRRPWFRRPAAPPPPIVVNLMTGTRP